MKLTFGFCVFGFFIAIQLITLLKGCRAPDREVKNMAIINFYDSYCQQKAEDSEDDQEGATEEQKNQVYHNEEYYVAHNETCNASELFVATQTYLSKLNFKILSIFVVGLTFVTMLKPMLYFIKQKILKLNRDLTTKFEYLRAIFDSVDIGIISTDQNMKITFMNYAAGKMCGYSPEAAVGKPISNVVYFADINNNIEGNIIENLRKQPCTDDSALVLYSHKGNYLDIRKTVTSLSISDEIVGFVMLLLDVTASRKVMKKLIHRASHDALTGLPNRASFENHLRNILSISQERNLQHALVYVDLDGFKAINDEASHAAGDELLKQLSQLMTSQLRCSDIVARLGGDEFGLILFNCGLREAKTLMEYMIKLINEYTFSWDGRVKHIGASIGITKVDSSGTDMINIKRLMAEADAACYAAKHRGKGQVCLFHETLVAAFY